MCVLRLFLGSVSLSDWLGVVWVCGDWGGGVGRLLDTASKFGEEKISYETSGS